MMPIALKVGQSWIFFSQKRSSRMVKSRVKRRSAMNIGTFSPAVPAGQQASRQPLWLTSGKAGRHVAAPWLKHTV